MEIFVLILVGAVIIILLSNFRSEVKKNMRVLNKNIINVRKELEEIKSKGSVVQTNAETPQKKESLRPKLKPLEVSGQRLDVVKPALKKDEPIAQPKTTTPQQKPVPSAEKKPALIQKKTVTPVTSTKQAIAKTVKPLTQPKPIAKPIKKEKTDYEKLIGENWLNKIGIAILVIGIGFFVKYAIDKNWIGEVGRVAIGLGTGGILIGVAHFLRKKYNAFSSVLIGGGISVMYYTISIAYHDYGIFNQKTAFGIMVLITLFSTFMSILYDRKELAIIALIGGFTSPFMVSNGSGNYITFFTYIAIINSGMLILSYFKKWNILSKLALGFTVLFFGAWLITTDISYMKPAKWCVVFASLFFVQFLIMSLIYNFVKKIKFNAWEFIQLSSISALYYGAMSYALYAYDFGISNGMFTLLMSLFYIGLAVFAQLRKGTDKALLYLLIGKAITFITLTGALLFDGSHTTVFWIIEAVTILALGLNSKMKVLNNASIILTIIALLSLTRDWMLLLVTSSLNSSNVTPTLVTSIFVIAGLIGTFILLKKETEKNAFFIRKTEYRFAIGSFAYLISYLTLLFELLYQLRTLHYEEGTQLILWIFHLAIVLAGFIIAKIRKGTLVKQIFFFAGCVMTLLYLVFAQKNNFEILTDSMASLQARGFYFLHYVLTIGIVGIILILRKSAQQVFEKQSEKNWFLTALSIIGLVIATFELDQIIGFVAGLKYGIYPVLKHTQTEGYTILWALYSFALMLMGMKKKNRIMRILALVIFSITLLKLFIFDIQNISEAGKIVAFISLGVLLLVISFMYQKLKQLIVGETVTNEDKTSLTEKVNGSVEE